jgi:hypothetical protein
LTQIPEELVNLKYLDCSKCFLLTQIPELVNLKYFNCSNCCKIKEIPFKFDKLTELIIYNCPGIITIPNYKNLQQLQCSNCFSLVFAPEHLIKDTNVINLIKSNYESYRKKQCANLVYNILEELVQRTWEPSRAMNWCWDEDEKKFMSEMTSKI